MSYQTEETISMIDGGDVTPKIAKNESYGLVAFMLLCLGVTSFMAGRAYNSASSASVMNDFSMDDEKCVHLIMDIDPKCGWSAQDCVLDKFALGEYEYESCFPPSCAEEYKIIQSACYPS